MLNSTLPEILQAYVTAGVGVGVGVCVAVGVGVYPVIVTSKALPPQGSLGDGVGVFVGVTEMVGVTDGVGVTSQSKTALKSKTEQLTVGVGVGVGHTPSVKYVSHKSGQVEVQG